MALPLSRTERQVFAGFAISVVVMAVLHEVMQLKELREAIQTQLLEDHYTVLGIPESASLQEIQTAFKRHTSQFQSRPQDEDSRIRRARVVTAHDTLSKAEARAAYDRRRRLVRLASDSLTVAFVGVPVVGALFVALRLLRALDLASLGGGGGPRKLDPRSFEGKLAAALGRLEASVEVVVDRGSPEDKLGLQLVAGTRAALRVDSVTPGGLVDRHNRKARDSAPERLLAAWMAAEVWPGDELTAVNGATRPADMMCELQRSTAATLRLTLRRPMKALLRWVASLELTRASADERWGCQMSLAKDGSNTLQVASVDSSGVVARWNLQNRPLAVLPGDRIIAVGGQLGADSMLAILRDPTVLASVWVVARGVRAEGPRPQEVDHGPFSRQRGDQKLGLRIGPALEGPMHGVLVEADGAADVLVKEVLSGYLVDDWNRRVGLRQQVVEGATVVAVNGRTDVREFTSELKKPSVTLRLRPPRGSPSAAALADASGDAAREGASLQRSSSSSSSAGRDAAAAVERGEATPLARRVLGRWAPAFLLPRSFEARLRDCLAQLRCGFTVKLSRGGGANGGTERVGLQLQPARDALGGLAVVEVAPDGLVDLHNRSSAQPRPAGRARPVVRVGDRLVSVNGGTSAAQMLEVLADLAVQHLELAFSRRAAEASPGVWEAELQRNEGEGWGMELEEQLVSPGRGGPGVLLVNSVQEGLAVDRWNRGAVAGGRWPVEVGDLVVACEPEVGHTRTLARLVKEKHVRLTLLRWHNGPAPEPVEEDGGHSGGSSSSSAGAAQAPYVFEVRLERVDAGQQRLGLRLDPSPRDPTRTIVGEVFAGGLVEAHNMRVWREGGALQGDRRAEAAHLPAICPGDEVDSINGERDPACFGDCCRAQLVVLRLSRRGPPPPAFAATATPPAPAAAAPGLPVNADAAAEASAPETHLPAAEDERHPPSPPPEITPSRPRGPGSASTARAEDARSAAAAAPAAPATAGCASAAPPPPAPALKPASSSGALPLPAANTASEAPAHPPAARAAAPPSIPLDDTACSGGATEEELEMLRMQAEAVKALSQDLAELEDEADALRAQLAASRAQEQALRAQLRASEAQVELLGGQVAELSSQEQELRGRLASSEAQSKVEVERLRGEASELRAQDRALREQLRRSEVKLAAADALRAQAGELEVQVDAWRHQVSELQLREQGLRAQLQQSEAESASAAALRADLASLQGQERGLREKLRLSEEHLAAAHRLQEDNEQLRAQLEAAEQAAAEASSRAAAVVRLDARVARLGALSASLDEALLPSDEEPLPGGAV